MTDDDPDALVTVAQARTEFEANVLKAVLEDEGIETFAFGKAHAALPLSVRFLRVPVQVRARDAARARDVLAANEAAAEHRDWEMVETGDREDRLPLGRPGRMPIPAKIGFLVAAAIILMMLVAFVLALIF